MRSAEQLGRTVGQYHDWQRAQRQKTLREVLTLLRHARERGDHWYRWITDGRPVLSQEEYERERIMRPRQKAKR